MSLTYSTFQSSLANLLVVPSTDANYATVLPNIIDDAEQRLYRDLDLINTIGTNASTTLTAGNRNFTLPDTFYVIDRINVITPATQTTADLGTRNALIPTTVAALDFLFPSSTGSGVPSYFGMVTQSTIVFGPWPDAAYTVEVVGTQRPAALSVSNTTTLLTQYFPDLFIAASMVFGAAYLKDFGASADDPKLGNTWEAHYQTLKQSALVEENRKKFLAEGWSSKTPSPIVTPPRT